MRLGNTQLIKIKLLGAVKNVNHVLQTQEYRSCKLVFYLQTKYRSKLIKLSHTSPRRGIEYIILIANFFYIRMQNKKTAKQRFGNVGTTPTEEQYFRDGKIKKKNRRQ